MAALSKRNAASEVAAGHEAPGSPLGVERREVATPDGRTLVVRRATAADVDGLVALYDELSVDDRHSRFFSAYRPDRKFLGRWVSRNDEGGLVLVVVDDTGAVLADAGYALVEDGNGEFALTVSPRARGWLGPYLLDVLVEEAARRGVPNLEAAILTTNRPMQAVTRHRGHAVVGHDDWSVVNVVIGTAGSVPSWPPKRRGPRVLVEGSGGRWHAEQEAREAGLEVLTCPGPAARPPGRGCPLLAGGTCPLVDGADAIVVALPRSDPRTAALLDAHATEAGMTLMIETDGARGDIVPALCRALEERAPGDPPAARRASR
jgi:hypothetical protein